MLLLHLNDSHEVGHMFTQPVSRPWDSSQRAEQEEDSILGKELSERTREMVLGAGAVVAQVGVCWGISLQGGLTTPSLSPRGATKG